MSAASCEAAPTAGPTTPGPPTSQMGSRFAWVVRMSSSRSLRGLGMVHSWGWMPPDATGSRSRAPITPPDDPGTPSIS